MKITGSHLLLLTLAVSLICGVFPEVACAQRFGKQPVPVAELGPIQDRAALMHVIVANRDPVLALKTLKKRLAEANHVEAAKILKEFGDHNQTDVFRVSDSLYWDADNKLASVLRELRREFGTNGVAAAEVYEREIGALAKKELDEARESNDTGKLGVVGRRYFFTAAGFAALDRVASLALDRRQPELAASVWIELLTSPVHAKRVTPGLVLKTGLALAQAGLTDELATFRTTAFKEFGLSARDREQFDVSIKRVSRLERRAPEDWLMGLGDATHNSAAVGTVPYLNPRWSRSLEGCDDQTWDRLPACHIPLKTRQAGSLSHEKTQPQSDIERAWQAKLQKWERQTIENEVAPIGVANWPIIAGEQLVVRDFRGVVGSDLATGRPLWAYRSAKSLFEVLDEVEGETGVGDRPLAEAYLGNIAAGLPSSDGERMFVIEVMGVRPKKAAPAVAPPPPGFPQGVVPRPQLRSATQLLNRLVCLNLPHAAQLGLDRELVVEPLWTAGGDADDRDDPLARHVFRGPPLPVGDAVFVVAEADQELHLLKLDAATGRLQRVTKLCMTEYAPLRGTTQAPLTPNCLLAEVGGTIICPTETGVLVAVDALLGEIKWVYAYADPRTLRERGSQAVLGWVDPPQVQGSSVIYLPRVLEQLHCVDRRTGLRQWAVMRDDAKSVGTVTDKVVVVVGTDFVRGLARDDGRQLWQTTTGLVSGRGTRIGELYVVPLKTGSVATLELKTGRTQGFGRTPIVQSLADGELPPLAPHLARELREFGHESVGVSSYLRPGNLVAHREHVVSVGPRFVTVFSQADSLKREVIERGRKKAAQPRDELLLADLELVLGETEAGEARLDRLMSGSGTGATTAQDRDLARQTQRQVVIALLDRDAPSSPGLQTQKQEQERLDRLEALSQSPDEQAQALALRIESGIEHRTWLAVGTAARELAKIRSDEFVVPRDSQQFAVRGGALAERAMTRAWSASAGLERDRLTQSMRADLAAAQRENSLASLSGFARLYASSAEADRVRNQVADRLLLAHRRHEAESVLRRNLTSESVVDRAAAHLLMATLLSQSDMHGEAARVLESLRASVGDADVSGVARLKLESLTELFDFEPVLKADRRAVTVTELLGTLRRETPLSLTSLDLQPIEWPVRLVNVINRSTVEARPALNEMYSLRRHELAAAQDIDIFQDYSNDGEQQHWGFGDRRLGTVRGRVTLPVQADVDVRSLTRSPLHVVPVGSIGALQGVSLLETHNDEPLWKLRYPPVERNGEMLEVGPVTATSCVFYSKRHLICVEAATGQVRWRRSDLQPPTGMAGDVNLYFLGDDEALTVFHGDGRHYTTLAMSTGELIGSGQVAFDPELNVRLALGRKLVYVHWDATGGNRRRLRIWDPLHDRFDLDEEFAKDALNTGLTNDGQLFVLSRDGHFRLFSPTRPEPVLDVVTPMGKLDPDGNSVMVCVDQDLVLVNLGRNQRSLAGRRFSHPHDSGIPIEMLRYGSVVAIDRRSGRVLWQRPELRVRSLLRMENVRLPFLVFAANVQPAGVPEIQSLEIEVVDRRTGEVLAISSVLEPSRLVHCELDRAAGRLSLYGLSRRKDVGNGGFQRSQFGMASRIDLEFGRPVQRLMQE